jgi:hypothetical protein
VSVDILPTCGVVVSCLAEVNTRVCGQVWCPVPSPDKGYPLPTASWLLYSHLAICHKRTGIVYGLVALLPEFPGSVPSCLPTGSGDSLEVGRQSAVGPSIIRG